MLTPKPCNLLSMHLPYKRLASVKPVPKPFRFFHSFSWVLRGILMASGCPYGLSPTVASCRYPGTGKPLPVGRREAFPWFPLDCHCRLEHRLIWQRLGLGPWHNPLPFGVLVTPEEPFPSIA